MKSLVIFIIIFSSTLSICEAGLPTDSREYAAWEARALEAIEKNRAKPMSVAIPALATWLLRLSTPGSSNMEKGSRTVFYTARDAMLSIPGHAHFYGESTEKNFEQSVERDETGQIIGHNIRYSHYENERTNALRILSLLPSPETVHVLGGMLDNDYRVPRGIEDYERNTLAEVAVLALTHLPIENRPTEVKRTYDLAEELPKWKQWYAEIESGRRTFHFVGDDTEYDLRGPVRRGAGMDSNRTGKRTNISTPGGKQIPEARPTPGRFLPYLIGGLVLLAGLGVYLRGKREHPKKHHSA